jgi:hypothetical protein
MSYTVVYKHKCNDSINSIKTFSSLKDAVIHCILLNDNDNHYGKNEYYYFYDEFFKGIENTYIDDNGNLHISNIIFKSHFNYCSIEAISDKFKSPRFYSFEIFKESEFKGFDSLSTKEQLLLNHYLWSLKADKVIAKNIFYNDSLRLIDYNCDNLPITRVSIVYMQSNNVIYTHKELLKLCYNAKVFFNYIFLDKYLLNYLSNDVYNYILNYL